MKNKNEWRLPTKDELVELHKSGKLRSFCIYWSSTTFASAASGSWVVTFGYGHPYSSTKTRSNYMCCVRTQKNGKLELQKNKSKVKMDWYDAMKYADNLNKRI